jgi:TatD DNase family protein
VGRKKSRRPTEFSAWGAVDSHAHLDRKDLGNELAEVLASAWHHGLAGIVAVAASSRPEDYGHTVALAHADSRIRVVAGVHPHHASRFDELRQVLVETLSDPVVLGLGEFGLDFHYDFSPRHVQLDVMKEQLEIAVQSGLPIVLHIREAFEEALSVLDSLAPGHPGIVHCFGGSVAQAEEFLKRGLYLSIPGIVTFGARVRELHEAVDRIPLDRLLVETDSPYLAPVPFRGRTNQPAYVAFVVEELARLKGVSPAALAAATKENTCRVLGIDKDSFSIALDPSAGGM